MKKINEETYNYLYDYIQNYFNTVSISVKINEERLHEGLLYIESSEIDTYSFANSLRLCPNKDINNYISIKIDRNRPYVWYYNKVENDNQNYEALDRYFRNMEYRLQDMLDSYILALHLYVIAYANKNKNEG